MPASSTARLAGLLYLLTVVTGLFSLMYVPAKLSVPGNPTATVAAIAASQPLYRLGIAAGLVCYTVFLAVPVLLYRLLGPINRSVAALMVLFGAVNVPIALLSIAKKLDVLAALNRAGPVPTIALGQARAQVQGLLDAYSNGMLISEIFAGLWLIPFGYLVFKSGFLPKIFGVLLVGGGVGYLLTVFGHVLLPDYDRLALATYDTLPAGLGEIGICLWLLCFGVRPLKPVAPAPQ